MTCSVNKSGLWSGNSSLGTTDNEQYIDVPQICKAMEEVESDSHP